METSINSKANIVDDFSYHPKSIIKQLILNFKFLASTKAQVILILSFPIMMMIIPVFFLPLRYSFSVYMFGSIISPVGIIYIAIAYNWRSSTLYTSQQISKNDKRNFYFSILITLILISIILFLVTLLLIGALGEILPFYYFGKSNSGGGVEVSYRIFREGMLLNMYYEILLCTLTMFSILFALQNVVQRKQTMYIFVFSIFILIIIFGGAFNNYFEDTISTDGKNIWFGYNASLFPDTLFWPTSILFPFFSPTQHLSIMGRNFGWAKQNGQEFNYVLGINGGWSFDFWHWTTINDLRYNPANHLPIGEVNKLDAIKWNILWFLPYIWVASFGCLGIFLSKIKK